MEQRFLHQVNLQENLFRIDDNPGRCFRIPYLMQALDYAVQWYLPVKLGCSCNEGLGVSILLHHPP